MDSHLRRVGAGTIEGSERLMAFSHHLSVVQIGRLLLVRSPEECTSCVKMCRIGLQMEHRWRARARALLAREGTRVWVDKSRMDLRRRLCEGSCLLQKTVDSMTKVERRGLG